MGALWVDQCVPSYRTIVALFPTAKIWPDAPVIAYRSSDVPLLSCVHCEPS
jgi:hypothetical protein